MALGDAWTTCFQKRNSLARLSLIKPSIFYAPLIILQKKKTFQAQRSEEEIHDRWTPLGSVCDWVALKAFF